MPDHHDADLILRLFDQRREAKLREARDFMLSECYFTDYEDFNRRYPMPNPKRMHWGKVMGYWEMVCSLINHGLLNEELFHDCANVEHVFLWAKFGEIIKGLRRDFGFPTLLHNIEEVAQRHPGLENIKKRVAMAKQMRADAEAAKSKPKAKAKKKAASR